MAADMSVEVQGDDIVDPTGHELRGDVLQGSRLPSATSHQSHSGREDEGAPMTQAEFHARAWKAASHKARALGWIV